MVRGLFPPPPGRTLCRQFAPLQILKALIENGDHKFQSMTTYLLLLPLPLPDHDPRSRLERAAACMDDHLIDALRQLAVDPIADTKVKKKLLSMLASWSVQFKNDPSLSTIAGLYRQARPIDRRSHTRSESADAPFHRAAGLSPTPDKDSAKRRAKQEKEEAKERARKAEEEARQHRNRPRRAPFNFEAVSVVPSSRRTTAYSRVFRRNH